MPMSDDSYQPTADYGPPRRTRWGIAALIVLLHVLVIMGLIRAFAPDFSAQVTEEVLSTFNVTITAPPKPPPPPKPEPERAGAEGSIGKKATPREAAAPKPKIPIAKQDAPPVAGKGTDNSSGARDTGQGTGAGNAGTGTGAGGVGNGQGGGGARRLEKIAGDINSNRDFPKKTRKLRNGHSVVIQMTVGTDGRASGCRVVQASPDPEADAIVCRLAEQRFRFKPRLDGSGNPVAATYRWQQRWWDPRAGEASED
jgi:periplasmic protein TonB